MALHKVTFEVAQQYAVYLQAENEEEALYLVHESLDYNPLEVLELDEEFNVCDLGTYRQKFTAKKVE